MSIYRCDKCLTFLTNAFFCDCGGDIVEIDDESVIRALNEDNYVETAKTEVLLDAIAARVKDVVCLMHIEDDMVSYIHGNKLVIKGMLHSLK